MEVKQGWRRRARRRKVLRFIFLGIIVIASTLPLLWTMLASIGIHPDNTRNPPRWTIAATLDTYGEVGAMEEGFWGELATSFTTSAASTLLTIVLAFPAAYGIQRARAHGSRHREQGFLILASLPVMAYVIPLDGTVRALHLHDTFGGLAVAQAAIFAPLAVYVLFGFLAQTSLDFEEAAVLDGASRWSIMARVVLPMHAPAVAATAIIVFVLSWNSFLAPMVLTTHHVRTIPLAMNDFFVVDRELEWPNAAATLIISFVPLAALVAASHRILQGFFLRASIEVD